MKSGLNMVVGGFVALTVACIAGGCESGNKSSGSGAPKAKVNPAAIQAQAKLPPPPNATQATSIGQGVVSVQTANSPGDTDSYWIQQIDIDGDGTLEQTALLWDDEDRVLYAYAQTDVPCTYGGTGVVAVLVGVNGAGNSRGRAAGSGFYAIYFDATECGADEAGLYGCKFDAYGNVTAWGEAVVDSQGDAVVIEATN